MRRARFGLLRFGLACPTSLANVLCGVRLLGGLSGKGVCARAVEVLIFHTFAVVRINRRLASDAVFPERLSLGLSVAPFINYHPILGLS